MISLLVQENVVDSDETRRLEALQDLAILDTEPEEHFDFIVRLAARLFHVPMVGFNLIDANRQWSKATIGLDPVIPRADAFCNVTIRQAGPLVVNDASTDPRFAQNPLVLCDPGIRFYAGQPLRAPGGERVGALCIIDVQPRAVSDDELDLLRDLARWVEKQMASNQELLDAAGMQQRLFPRTAPQLVGYSVAGRCLPARLIGGDFYDWYEVDDQYQFVLGDVMGKGIQAGMFATSVRALLRGCSMHNDVGEAVTRSAHSLRTDLEAAGSFATAFCARLDPPTGRLQYVDAGHGLNGVIGNDGTLRHLASEDLPIGVVPDDTWTTHTTVLEPGDTLVSVSDGWMDLFSDGQQAMLAGREIHLASSDPEDHVARIMHYARAHDATDDVTVVVIARHPASPQTDEELTP